MNDLEFKDEKIIEHNPKVKKDETEAQNEFYLETQSIPEEEDKVECKTEVVDNQPAVKYKPLKPTEPEPLPDFKKKEYFPEKKERKLFWKLYAIVVTIIIILGIIGLALLIKKGYLTPKFNSTNENVYNQNFNPTITTPVSNDYENTFNNTVEINFDLSDEFINKLCNSS